jgi:hypothetical protein
VTFLRFQRHGCFDGTTLAEGRGESRGLLRKVEPRGETPLLLGHLEIQGRETLTAENAESAEARRPSRARARRRRLPAQPEVIPGAPGSRPNKRSPGVPGMQPVLAQWTAHSCLRAFQSLSAFHQCPSAFIGGSNAFDPFSALSASSAVKHLSRKPERNLCLLAPLLSRPFPARAFLLFESKIDAGAIR